MNYFSPNLRLSSVHVLELDSLGLTMVSRLTPSMVLNKIFYLVKSVSFSKP